MFPEELRVRGWDALDVLLISGDAYIDHPSFGAAVMGRLLEAQGYRVGIVAQPSWKSTHDVMRLGRPRLFAGVTAGCMDSMVNHYTAHRRLRSSDAYTPDAVAGRRPDRAATVYTRLVRQAFGPTLPIILGGVEASLRRIAHYDYWEDRVLPSILTTAPADLLVYGQGEKPILEIARRLASGEDICGLVDIPGTAFAVPVFTLANLEGRSREVLTLPSYEEVSSDKKTFAVFSRLYHLEHNYENARILVQHHGSGEVQRIVVVNPPMAPPTTEELDRVYDLPFQREAHPCYRGAHLPALEQIRWSIAILRGCAGGCSFCCITEHQGREISSRSEKSVLREIETMTQHPQFRGTLTDLGGATANMWQMGCTHCEAHRLCRRLSCVYPKICQFFAVDHGPLVELYDKAKAMKGVKHAFVGSGVRYDLAHADQKNGQRYLEVLVGRHVCGQLKVAPEHVCEGVLRIMKKPGLEAFERFRQEFNRYSKKAGKEQYLVPYFISSHPGCNTEDAVRLMEYLKSNRWRPQQVQDFIPTPMTLASDMHWSGYHPFTGQPVHVTRSMHDKRMQKALIRWADPRSRLLVDEALKRTGRAPLARQPVPPWKRVRRPRTKR